MYSFDVYSLRAKSAKYLPDRKFIQIRSELKVISDHVILSPNFQPYPPPHMSNINDIFLSCCVIFNCWFTVDIWPLFGIVFSSIKSNM